VNEFGHRYVIAAVAFAMDACDSLDEVATRLVVNADVAAQVQRIPINGLGWQVIRFGIEVRVERVRDRKTTPSDLTNVFASSSRNGTINLCLRHRLLQSWK
jgi:hypothetical protein